ncbi:glutaredoxin family protein [Sutcliffiella halmapala]|uniref:glutaredoxin family protein n=1 Tax=Sutcliffiella halmapala TaxID=79882 RepID=UPI0009956ED7|nr:glutaredoxin family protein [Sutcliffiella halmapala]
MSEKVVVYSAKGCKECEMVKDYLTQEGIDFEVRDILANQVYQQEVENFGFMGIPVTAFANQAVKGFNPGELNKIIALVK